MRICLFTVLLGLLGACGLVLDSQTSSNKHAPDASVAYDAQHDGGGCDDPPDAGPYPDAGIIYPPPDAPLAYDGGSYPYPDATVDAP